MVAAIFEAKTNLSALVKKAQSGETVIITSGRNKTPVAKLEPIVPVVKKRLGAMEIPGYEIPESFWDPSRKTSSGYGKLTAREGHSRHSHSHLSYHQSIPAQPCRSESHSRP